jgi:RNA polymerase sigma-32 factor
VRTLFFNLNRLRLAHGVAIGTAIPPDVVTEISRVLGVTAESVIDMDRVLSCPGASIDAPIGDSEDFCLRDILRDDSPSAEDMVGDREEEFLRQRAFGEALSCLTGRERDILASRCLRDDPETLESLGSRYSVSKERVRQIEVAAVRKLGVGVRGRIADRSGTLSLVAMR